MEVQDIVQEARQEIESFRKKHPDGVVIIRWATATGKSKLSVLLSEYFDIEVISADSRQIFRYMNIWTDKISSDIIQRIPHHQIDIVDPDQTYTSWQRKNDVYKLIPEIQARKRLPMIVGGTGLYIDTVYKNFSMPDVQPDMQLRDELFAKEEKEPGILHRELMKVDPEEASKLHPKSTRYIVRALEIYYKSGKTKTDSFISQPPQWPLLMLGLRRDKEDTNLRINARIKEMIAGGLVEEVQGLLKQWYSQPPKKQVKWSFFGWLSYTDDLRSCKHKWNEMIADFESESVYTKDLQSMQGIGYKEVVKYIDAEYSSKEMEDLMKITTHQLAKKQRSRFRRYIAEGIQSPRPNVTYKVWKLS